MVSSVADGPIDDPLVEGFDRLAANDGEAVVVDSLAGRCTRQELRALSFRVAARLTARGILPGQVVGLAAANGAGFLAGLLGVRRVGAAVLLLDSGMPERERLSIGAAMGARGVLQVRSALARLGDFGWLELRGELVTLAPEVGFLKLTSGSSGRPSGILTPSRCLLADDRALAISMGLRDEDRIVAAVPMSHSYGLSSIALPALARGSVVLVSDTADPFAVTRVLGRLRPTVLPTAPAYLGALTRRSEAEPLPDSLRLVLSAGAPLAPEVARLFRATFGRPVHVFYGASECGGITFDPVGDAAERGTVGRPVAGVALDVSVDGDPGGAGRLTVRSPAVALGYHPAAGDRLDGRRFVTDDLVTRRGRELVLEGRIGHLVNIRGRKVNPREVERVLMEMPGVGEVAVLGLTPEGGTESVVRAVVCTSVVAVGELREWCRRRLASHKIPRSFVRVDDLPRTLRGKIDRRSLSALAAGGGDGA